MRDGNDQGDGKKWRGLKTIRLNCQDLVIEFWNRRSSKSQNGTLGSGLGEWVDGDTIHKRGAGSEEEIRMY